MRATSSALAALGITMASGCLQDPVEPIEIDQGLTIIEATEGSLAVAYRRDEHVIYFHAQRGRPTPEPYQSDPGSPKFEVDARLVADDGRIFFVQQGGDRFVDPTWADDLEAQYELAPMRISNRLLFEMAGEAAGLMTQELPQQLGAGRADALAPELGALHALGEQAPATYVEMRERMLGARIEAGLPEVQEIEYGEAGPESPDQGFPGGYYWNVNLHQDDIQGSPAGYHSATRVHRWDGYWAAAHDFCNHGRCPGIDGMESTCYAQWDAPVGSDLKPAWTGHSCNTGYDMTSDEGGHNCHDDGRLQMASFVYGANGQGDPGGLYWCNGNDDDTDISTWILGDSSGYPECSASNSMGWVHPHMCLGNTGYNSAGGCYCDSVCSQYGDCCGGGSYRGPW